MKKIVSLLGVPSDLGANRDGSGLAPSVLRKELCRVLSRKKIKFIDYGNVTVPRPLHIDEGRKRHYKAIKILSENYTKKDKWKSIDNSFPIIFGGDHSATMFHMGELSKEKKAGLLYFDSHGDFNTPETTLTGNIHGMVISRCVGKALLDLMPWKKKFIDEKNVVLMGIRNLDKEESRLLKASEITFFTMKEIKKLGCKKIMNKALKIVNDNTEGFHLSIDIDVVDPKYAPAVSTPVKDGLGKSDLFNIIKMSLCCNVLSADFVEYIPRLDKNHKTSDIIIEAAEKLAENFA